MSVDELLWNRVKSHSRLLNEVSRCIICPPNPILSLGNNVSDVRSGSVHIEFDGMESKEVGAVMDGVNYLAVNNATERDAKEDGECATDGDVPDRLLKHPLQNRWAFWYYKNDKHKDWKENQKIITTFDTVEDFWAVFNYIQPASKIPLSCDYSVFKDGIEPMWEDARNRRGGRWVINLEKRRRGQELDNFWLETLLCLIGEAFEDLSEEICGAVINVRNKGDKLGLWTADASKGDHIMMIGRILKSRLNIPSNLTIGYEAHQDSWSKSGSTAKSLYHV